MPNEIITIQLGQCGNQIGFELWKGLCKDHGINSNGELPSNAYTSSSICPRGNFDAFFYQADDKRFIPRSVLVDLEPRVINCIMNSEYSKLFTQENILMASEGGGAGNNWAKGYVQSRKLEENLFDIIDRISEDCESMDGIMICHSMAGGTGSGMGSHLLECLAERYPKKTVQTLSVFPNQDEMGDVVVQAYNSLLMLERLTSYSDAVFVLHNGAFQRIIEDQFEQSSPSYSDINGLIVKIMNNFTNPIRFPAYHFSTLTSLIAPMSPTPSMHFLTSSFTPWNPKASKTNSLRRIMLDLLKSKNMVVSGGIRKKVVPHEYLAILDIVQGAYSPAKVFEAIGYIRENQHATFAPWVPDSLQVLLANVSTHFEGSNYSSGLMVANDTSIGVFLEQILHDFDRLKKRRAFLEQFSSTGIFSANFAEMDLARDAVDCLLQEYCAATRADFLQWVPMKRGNSPASLEQCVGI